MMRDLPPASQTRAVLGLIVATTAARLLFAAATGLGVDESYMVSAGRLPGLGYFDHPPASWWLSWGAARLAGTEAAIVVRLPFITLFALSTWLMYRLGRAVAEPRAGFWAAVALNLTPVFGITTGTWVLPDGPLVCALLGAALCLVHAIDVPADAVRTAGMQTGGVQTGGGQTGGVQTGGVQTGGVQTGGVQTGGVRTGGGQTGGPGGRLGWWAGAGICAGLALFAKYSAVLTIGGAFLFLLISRPHRIWLRRHQPWLGMLLAVLVFSPVIVWNAIHDWASFVFQGERAAGLRFRPLAPFEVLGGGALFVLPWLWVPMVWLGVIALRRGPPAHRLLACLAAPPILGFALIAAWSSHRVLFHWAAPGYLMLFPLLGQAIAERIGRRWVRRGMAASGALIVTAVTVIGLQTHFDVLGPALAAMRIKDPTPEGVDWSSLHTELTARGLLGAGTLVGLPNWRDGGKIARGLGPGVPVVVLNRDARQFGVAFPASAAVGRDMVVLIAENPEQTAATLAPLFARMERLADAPVLLRGRVLKQVAVFQAERLLRWPP